MSADNVVELPARPRTFDCSGCGGTVHVATPIDNVDRCLTCRFLDEHGPHDPEERRQVLERLRHRWTNGE